MAVNEWPGSVFIYKIRHRAKAYAWHLSLIGLVVGLLWAGIGFNLGDDHQAAERQAVNDTTNLARAFDENITRTVDAVDQTLLFVREAVQHDRAGFIAGSWMGRGAFRDDLRIQLALTDRAGNILWSNLGLPPGGINIADRQHFIAQKTSVDDNLFIGRPVLGRVSRKWTIQFTRKLLAPDGSFDGIAIVSLDPSYLSRFYDSISIGNGSIILATIDGVVLARSPDRLPIAGAGLPPDVMRRILGGTTNGSYRTISGIDHVDRIFSSRRLERYPLVLAVGLASDDVFAMFERNKRLYLATGATLSVVAIIIAAVMLRQRQSLVDSRQALAATLENISQGIVMIRADGSIPVLNHRMVELLGLPDDLIAGRPAFQQIIDWQYANGEFGEPATLHSAQERLVRGTGGLHGDYTHERTRPDGSVLEIRTQGLVDGAVVRTFADITDRKRNEAALAEAQARAAHAERMQALGELAGGIAHDFNNILQAVRGGASLIDKRADDAASVQRFARMILDATERGTSLTGRLLSFARRGELRAEPVEPAELLTGLRDVLAHTLSSAIEVDLLLAPDLPPLLADKGQLETALVNLATNARDAMPGGGSLVFAAALDVVEENANRAADLRPGRYVRLSISDTGTGIDLAILARVLEPFFSTKPPGQGTGLGLSMAKGFAEQSGGGLSIESRINRGTTISLWLPAAATAEVRSHLTSGLDLVRNDRGRRILLVDDEAMVRETLAASLEELGYTVMVAADGAEALALLQRPEVMADVLITDLSMRGIDGLALIREAQRLCPGLPAVLLTGYAGHGAQLAVGGSLSGTFTLVRKPITAAYLADRIDSLLAVALAS